MASVIGRMYRRLRDVETPLNRTAKVEYAKGRESDLTESLGGGYSTSVSSSEPPPLKKTPACGTRPKARNLPSLPEWIESVDALWPEDPGEWPGAVCIARCKVTTEAFIAERLGLDRVSYYLPHEKVVKEYDYGGRIIRREYLRSMFPGALVVADGFRGREAAAQVGRRYADTVYGFIEVHSSALRFRQDILTLSRVLKADPDLRSIRSRGIAVGQRVRVTRGLFMGCVGVLIEEKQGHRFAVSLPLMGRMIPTDIGVEYLEPVEENT